VHDARRSALSRLRPWPEIAGVFGGLGVWRGGVAAVAGAGLFLSGVISGLLAMVRPGFAGRAFAAYGASISRQSLVWNVGCGGGSGRIFGKRCWRGLVRFLVQELMLLAPPRG